MNNTATRYKIAGALIALAVAFASGRYSVNGTIETKKVDTKINQDKIDHKKIVIDKKPTGEITTIITDDSDTKTNEMQKIDETKTNAAAKRSVVNVAGIVANDFRDTFKPVYGMSVNKEILGPMTIGVFGLTNGVIGISVGVNF